MENLMHAVRVNEYLAALADDSGCVLVGREIPSEESLSLLQNEYGFAPGFSLLVHALAKQDAGYVRQVMTFLEGSVNTLLLPSKWLYIFWLHIAPEVDDPPSRHAAICVVDLHLRFLKGGEIQSKEWRAARAAFPSAIKTAPEAAAAVIASAAWDPRQVPGAVSDAVLAFHEMAHRKWESEAGWTILDDEWAQKMDDASIEHAKTAAGAFVSDDPTWFDTIEGRAWSERFNSAYEGFREVHCQRMNQRSEGIKKTYRSIFSLAQKMLLEVISDGA